VHLLVLPIKEYTYLLT